MILLSFLHHFTMSNIYDLSHKTRQTRLATMVGPGGLEPPTSRLSGVRSNQAELRAQIGGACQNNQPFQRSNKFGGAGRDRTDDLMLAKHALSQLSYSPSNYRL